MGDLLERRGHTRAVAELDAVVTDSRGGAAALKILDLSEGGLRGQTALTLHAGDEVGITLLLGEERFVLDALVLRCAESAGTFTAGMRWRSFAPGAQEALRTWVSHRAPIAWSDEGGDRAASETQLPAAVARKFVPRIRSLAAVIARRARGARALTVDDLVGAGFVALVETHARHRGLPPDDFERMANTRIRGAMIDELRRDDPVPRRVREQARELRRVRKRLQGAAGEPPSHEDIVRAAGSRTSMTAALGQLTPSPRAYVLRADESEPVSSSSPEELMEQAEARDRVQVALAALPERLKHLLDLHYQGELTLREIGNLIGVSEARVSQLLARAVRELRERTGGGA